MRIKRISSGARLPGRFPFSLDGAGNGIVFISGMPAPDAAASGCGASGLLHAQVLLADTGNHSDISTRCRGQFPDPATVPARLTFQTRALPFGARIEFQAPAAAGSSR